jgi:outer membrane receptor protein involved in Fe transport
MSIHRRRRPDRRFALVIALLSICLPAGPTALAQGTGTLRGRVTDKLGAPLPGVTVSLKSPSRPETANRGAVTDARGEYRISPLPTATDYQVSASFPGMGTVVQGPVTVRSETLTTLDFILLEEMVTTIRVEATGDIVDTTTTSSSTTISEEFLATLPILGRSYTDLLTLAPGVTDTDNDGKPNVRGAREVDFQTRLDGANVTDPFSGEDASGINIEAIQEIQVISGGANAEYGRTQGGLATVTTKSGGNDVEGAFKVFYQTGSLDGDGAHNQDTINLDSSTPSFRTLKPFFTLGGPIRKDRAWFFLAVQYIDQQEPVNIIGVTRNETLEGWNNFGKMTWQINPSHKAILSVLHDPRETTGNVLGVNISPRTDYSTDVATPVLTAQETWVATPTVLLETTVSYLSGRQKVRPVVETSNQAITCASLFDATCEELSPRFPNDTYNIKFATGQIEGPWWVSQDSDSTRFTAKQDLSFYVDDFLGSHQFKAGFEWNAEDYSTTVEQRPLRYEFAGLGGRPGQDLIYYADFENRVQNAESSADAYAFYLQDTWQIRPNLTLNLGVRLDHERLRAPGQTFFDPAVERAAFNDLASQMFSFGVGQTPNSPDWTLSGYVFNLDGCDIAGPNGGAPDGQCDDWDILALSRTLHRHESELSPSEFFPPTAGEEDAFDLPPCGDPLRQGTCRGEEEIDFSNTNIAPRLSISYDPFSTGKTKIYGSWGRFYDRLFLAAIIPEQARDFTYVSWDVTSTSLKQYSGASGYNFQIYQVDRSLQTPYVDEWTLGFEREISPEFSVSVLYVERTGHDQLQSRDINHYTVDANFDGLPDDVVGIGSGGSPTAGPDGYKDLYAVNPYFGGIFRVGNFNTSEYRGVEIHLVKRLHRNWQFDASYTYSEALGNAEAFDDFFLGGDTSQVENEYGYLSYDQRHVVKFSAAAHFPRQVIFGGRILWESGLPFSLIRRGFTVDNLSNPTFRTIYPTEQRNDHRNEGRWLIDLNLRKDFDLGRTKAGVELTVENLLNSDDLEIQSTNDFFESFQLTAVRRFGRRFQLGFTMNF